MVFFSFLKLTIIWSFIFLSFHLFSFMSRIACILGLICVASFLLYPLVYKQGERPLPLYVWSPVDIQEYYWYIYGYQFLHLVGATVVGIGNDSLNVHCYTQIHKQFTFIGLRFKDFIKQTKQSLLENRRNVEYQKRTLTKIVEHHQNLHL